MFRHAVSKQIFILSLLLAVLLAGVLGFEYLYNETANKETTLVSQKLLKASPLIELSGLKGVDIVKHGETRLKARYDGKTWLDYQFNKAQGFPLQSKSISRLLRQIQSAKILEQKSSDTSMHGRLGLRVRRLDSTDDNNLEEVIGDHDSYGVQVKLRSTSDVELVIGSRAKVQSGQFVKYANSNQSYLVDQAFSLPDNSFDWLEKRVFPFSRQDIIHIAATQNEARAWLIEQKTKTNPPEFKQIINASSVVEFNLADLRESEDLRFDRILTNYIDTLTELEFTTLQYSPSADSLFEDAELTLEIRVSQKSSTGEVEADENNFYNTMKVAFFSEEDVYFLRVLAEQDLSYLNYWRFVLPDHVAQGIIKNREDFLSTPDKG